MSHALDVFEFPAVWKGKICLSLSSFMLYRCSFMDGRTFDSLKVCERYAEPGSDVVLCSCHNRCQVHCTEIRTSKNTLIPPQWPYLLAPYIDVAVCDPWNEKVMADCARKLSSFDDDGLGVLHRLLQYTDDDELLRKFLEIGVDPEERYVVYKQAKKLYLKKSVGEGIVTGGSAVHFALHFGRKKCLKTLLEAGVNLDAKRNDGLSAADWIKGEDTSEEDDPISTTWKSFALLAKEGRFFAMRHRMRVGKINSVDLKSTSDGKTAFQWCLAIMFGKHAVHGDGQTSDKHVASQILVEMEYRYGQEGRAYGVTPYFLLNQQQDPDGVAGQSNLAAAAADLEDLRKKQDLILEVVYGLSGLKDESGEKK